MGEHEDIGPLQGYVDFNLKWSMHVGHSLNTLHGYPQNATDPKSTASQHEDSSIIKAYCK